MNQNTAVAARLRRAALPDARHGAAMPSHQAPCIWTTSAVFSAPVWWNVNRMKTTIKSRAMRVYSDQTGFLRMNAVRAQGFSLIELLIVLAIVGIIASIGIGALMKAMQRNRVVTAVEAVVRVHNEARARAISAKPSLADSALMFGVAVIPPSAGQSGYAVLLKGSDVSDVMMVDVDGDGSVDREVLKVPFGIGVDPIVSRQDDGENPEPLAAPVCWWYSWGSGDPLATTVSVRPISIGTPRKESRPRVVGDTAYGDWGTKDLLAMATPTVPASPICSALAFRQGRIIVALEIYPMGPVNWEVNQ